MAPGPATLGLASDTPWSEKYRPRTLDEVSSHKDIIETVRDLAESDQLPHLLFYGPPGTGKTTTCLALARLLYGGSVPPGSVLELNASDDRGIAAVRNEIKEFAGTRSPVAGKPKLIVLDECDAMTRDAQMALRRIMEASVRNARFCLICNYVGKVIPALQSRCARFRFRPLPADAARARIEAVCDAEGVDRSSDPEGVDALLTLGQGDMRRTLNLLQAVAMASQGAAAGGADGAGAGAGAGSASASASASPPLPILTAAAAYACAGKPHPAQARKALSSLLNDDLTDAFSSVRNVQREAGVALVDLVLAVHPLLFTIACPEPARAVLVKTLADVEQRLAGGSNETLQLGAVLAAFVTFRGAVAKAAA